MKQLVPIAILILLATNAESSAVSQTYVCGNGNATRTIEIVRDDPSQSIPCQVLYRTSADAGKRVLWAAQAQPGFCEDKSRELVGKLEDGGWRCTGETQQEPQVISWSFEEWLQSVLYEAENVRFEITGLQEVDLNGDKTPEYIVETYQKDRCGSGGECPIYIFQKTAADDGGLRIIGKLLGKSVEVLNGTKRVFTQFDDHEEVAAYRYIGVHEDEGGADAPVVYLFDGRQYVKGWE